MKITWSEPIEVGSLQGDIRAIHGPSEALHCLAEAWPDRRGPFYVQARRFCRAAIDGRRTLEEAREMFISAAREARLNAH
ncbi:DUF982 domain-containing protein [Rhizobium sp. CFBP 8762]|uniref:DUF982 domain-containing protein n=1 Tax=Rhizobium sp. CFBP 8762 TaxID=2775279 RepID=UPI00177A9511|nr:DUF982 domain-containing protein [Rhizobium sp. CFBP 8762]MBD8555874.1 DUF982 domain-containing protein [Rhizobium sp. CFBP 8762]